MDAAVAAAVIAAVATGVGWLVSYVSSMLAERQRQRHTAQLAHIEKQLEQLYGPLVFLIHEGRAAFEDLVSTMGRRSIFVPGVPISDEDLKLWLFWVDNDLMPRNAAIQTLLSTHSHLIAGSSMPDSYLAFLNHYNTWRVSHLRWKNESQEYSWHSKTNWPVRFENDVIDTFALLKQEHARLVGMIGG